MILRYIFGWFALLIVAVLNGTIRDKVYKERLGDLTAHQVSTFTGILLFGVVIWGMSRLWRIESSRQAWTIGLIWLVMTMCFEFFFFHYVTGHSWSELLGAYDIFEGRIWVLALLWVLVAPYIFWRMGGSLK